MSVSTDGPRPKFGNVIGPWRRWFAWHPCCTYDGEWLFFRMVQRRRFQIKEELFGGPDQWWQYKRADE